MKQYNKQYLIRKLNLKNNGIQHYITNNIYLDR